MNTPDAIPTGGPFITRPTCGGVPYKMRILEFKPEFNIQRYGKWINTLPKAEFVRRVRQLYENPKQQLDNERSGSILGA